MAIIQQMKFSGFSVIYKLNVNTAKKKIESVSMAAVMEVMRQ